MPQFYEFFAGGGMAQAGLGHHWACRFANDFDEMKAATYCANWGGEHMVCGDVNDIKPGDVPELADLAWASFPCQDLSLAGNYAGIGAADSGSQTRSGAFWAFWKLMLGLKADGRAPNMIVLENVSGVLTANKGRDFAAIGDCIARAGYRFGAVLIDAIHFVPHSRPRVFIVAIRADLTIPDDILTASPILPWHPGPLVAAFGGMTDSAKDAWLWLNLPTPDIQRRRKLESIIDDNPEGLRWHTSSETDRLISMMSERNLGKLERMKSRGQRTIGTIYKRTRQGQQRAELRDDGISGCLRTPAGGSSRQLILVVDGERVRSRLLAPREAARLMGLPDQYKLPSNYNHAYHVAGDGVAVPVVRHLAAFILEPVLQMQAITRQYAVAAE
ncbi:DNA cytosine methyltransferase [Sphingobium boeckii]|uniref:DNA (cytosine-5-)-methyltransferase n=1 Tax=Sphingobium boeckii TaxID=1082345 RepID=A0A7W9EFX1_9SPHN|nr:DNA cytosine methyltransferase [Sphingobium boeckii]MBB5687574.1 DNA (cytosine-5)-methyltransferase 1 [Sphingobium boeckii]